MSNTQLPQNGMSQPQAPPPQQEQQEQHFQQNHHQVAQENATNEALSANGKGKKKTKGRAFQCTGYPPCSMSFTRSEHLARHIRSHTGEKPFKCQHCQKNFSRLDNLRQHRQTVHAYENFILTYPNEKLMIRVRNDEFNEVKKNLGIDENNMIRVSQPYQEEEVNVAQQLSDLRNLPSPNPITPVTNHSMASQQQQQQPNPHNHHHLHPHRHQQQQHPQQMMLSPPNSTSPHNTHDSMGNGMGHPQHQHHLHQENGQTPLPPPRSSSSSLLRPLQFRPDNHKRPRPIVVPDSENSSSNNNSPSTQSQQNSAYLSTPLSGRSLQSPLSPYYNSQYHHLNHLNTQVYPPSSAQHHQQQFHQAPAPPHMQSNPNSAFVSPYQANFPALQQDATNNYKKLPAIKFRNSKPLTPAAQSPVYEENRNKMKVSTLMNEEDNTNKHIGQHNDSINNNSNSTASPPLSSSSSSSQTPAASSSNQNTPHASNGFKLPSFKELAFK